MAFEQAGQMQSGSELIVVAFQSTTKREFVITAYTAGPESTGKTPDHPAYGITRSGRIAVEGRTIAVDPDIIPLGTLVYIDSIGLRIADDTGGKIKGPRIDIFLESLDEALHFGVQRLRVCVLRAVG